MYSKLAFIGKKIVWFTRKFHTKHKFDPKINYKVRNKISKCAWQVQTISEIIKSTDVKPCEKQLR